MAIIEHGNLSTEQQAKLMREIKTIEDLEDDQEAFAAEQEMRKFIALLFTHGFIGSDKACRYRQGLEMAVEKRYKRGEAR